MEGRVPSRPLGVMALARYVEVELDIPGGTSTSSSSALSESTVCRAASAHRAGARRSQGAALCGTRHSMGLTPSPSPQPSPARGKGVTLSFLIPMQLEHQLRLAAAQSTGLHEVVLAG